MINREVFPNAPITEALLDIKVELPPDINLETLETFYQYVKDIYSQKKQRMAWKQEIKIHGSEAPKVFTPSGGPDGFMFESPEDKKAVQARLDGFTFNKLKPYDDWETFVAEARELWAKYVQLAKPIKVTRIGLRYINRIEIPLPFNDFKEYILTVPEIPPGIPSGLSDFFMRLVIPDPKNEIVALVTETIEPGATNNKLPLIFDIDVFKEGKFDVSDGLWDIVQTLWSYKNTIFFNSITDKAKELFV